MRIHPLIYLLAFALSATAQDHVAPRPAYAAGNVKFGSKWYINGGIGLDRTGYSGPMGQFFVLDLSKPWASTSPAWTELPEGPAGGWGGSVMSLDGKIFMTSPGIVAKARRYSFESKTWSVSKASFRETIKDLQPVTLGTDGTVLIAGGTATRTYDIYSLTTDMTMTAQLPLIYADIPVNPKVVWSEPLKSAILFGGFNTGSNNITLTLYHAEKQEWSTLKTKGVNATVTTDFCLAITDDGKKLLSYGGNFPAPISNLYILNLETGIWTEAANSGVIRASAACIVAGDYFLLWGGAVGGRVFEEGKPSTPVLIYQISSDKWVSEYKPSANYTSTTSATGSAPTFKPTEAPTGNPLNNNDPDVPTNIGAIAGGAAGAAVVMALVGFLIWRRRNQGTKQSRQHESASDIDQYNATADKIHDNHEHGVRRMPQTLAPEITNTPPQYVHDSDDAADKAISNRHDSRDGRMYATKHSTPPRAIVPHYPSWGASLDDSDDAADIATSNRRNIRDAAKHNTPPRAIVPHYPSWGASFEDNFVNDAFEFSKEISPRSPSSPTSQGHYVPPPPPHSQSSRRQLRGPQLLDYKHKAHGHLDASDGQWAKERPGPQWHPNS